MRNKNKLSWSTELRKVKDLLPYEKNPRRITDKQMLDLQRSLKKFNLAEIPAINRDGKIVAGHMRVKALILLGRGEEEIEVRVPSRNLTESEFKDYLLTSNRSGGSWDFDLLAGNFNLEELTLSGFDDIDLSHIFDSHLEVKEDDWDEEVELKKIKKTDIKLGDQFSLGRHSLICADALDPNTVKKLTGDVRVDLIDDDLPFNINLSYDKGVGGRSHYGGTTDDDKTDEQYSVFVETIMRNALSVAKKNCHVLFWTDERNVWIFQTLYKKLKIDSKRLLIWIKNNASPTPQVAFNKATEFIVYGTIGKPYLSNEVKNLNEIINKETTTGNNLFNEISDHLNLLMVKRLPGNQYNHPTQKSPAVHDKVLRRCTKPGDAVLDLTAGSGSILVACESLKRTAYLCEKEPIFCQLIINRFEKITGLKAKKIHEEK